MKENFPEDQLQDIFYNMRRVEPTFNFKSDDELRTLTEAIYKCGYTWSQQDRDIGFYHPDSKLILNFKGLHRYSPESIIRIYNSTWSKDSFDKQTKRKNRVKIFRSFWLWVFSFTLLFFVDIKYARIIIPILFVRFLYLTIKASINK